MNLTKFFTNLLAEIGAWWTTLKSTVATYRTLYIVRLRVRWATTKAWFIRKAKVIFWSLIVLMTTVVAVALLAYFYRRSPTVRATMDNLFSQVLSWPASVLNAIRNWLNRRIPQPIKAIAGPSIRDEPQVVAAKAEPIPAIPSQDGPLPEEMKL
jgi:hypothetical protein